MSIEIRQLRYFLTVAELLHFGRAALKLNMTQPPLSQAIQALEIQIGVSLFVRNTRNIRLTAAGLALIPEAQKILNQAQALPEFLQRVATGKTGQISLAFVSIADYSILPNYLRQFRQMHDCVQIELREATSDIQHDLLENGEIDAGFLIPPVPARLQHLVSYRKFYLSL